MVGKVLCRGAGFTRVCGGPIEAQVTVGSLGKRRNPFSVTRCVSMRGKVRTRGVCIRYSRPFSVHYNQVLPDAVVVEELPRVTP